MRISTGGNEATTILITGGAGFVLSNVARRLLQDRPDATMVILDRYTGDALAQDLLAEYAPRVFHVAGDIRDGALLEEIGREHAPTHVIHGAALTHQRALEHSDPRNFVDVNINGTMTVLEWARRLPGLRRFVYVSTGAVYGTASHLSPRGPQPEDGPFDPAELYGITKYTSELISRRYRTLYGMDVIRVRYAGVFGPMERATGARIGLSPVYKMMRARIEGRPLRVTARTMASRLDVLSAEDIGSAMSLLLDAPGLPFDLFNISAGHLITAESLFAAFAAVAPGFTTKVVGSAEAEMDFDPDQVLARNNAYDITRMESLGWRARSLAEQLAGYRDWVMQDEASRCPPEGVRVEA